jgi:dephospho-CoA kinase
VTPSVPRPCRLGLTGGIGSGKTTVGLRLQSLGADLIDADACSRACTAEGGAAIPAIEAAFGPDMITADGAMDRERMRSLVFSQPAARQRLEAIVHPLVATAIASSAAASRARCIVFDVPLLVETARWRPQLDLVVVVDCSEQTQMRRVKARSGWDDATTSAVMRHQSPRALRLAAADAVVFNDVDDIDRLHATIDRLSTRFGL